MENAITFGSQASQYASARPHYPETLFNWIAENSNTNELVWDVGTGSGQAAIALAEKFETVYATDIDTAQISKAPTHPNIIYMQNPAHESGLSSHSVDAITVATALHWFDFNLFWDEVRRVARPDALFCAWTYHRAKPDEETENILMRPIREILKPYWSDGNKLSWRGYTKDEIGMPFETVTAPKFVCNLNWSSFQIISFVRSWSAHKKARLDGHTDALAIIEREATKALGSSLRPFALPLHLLAARIN